MGVRDLQSYLYKIALDFWGEVAYSLCKIEIIKDNIMITVNVPMDLSVMLDAAGVVLYVGDDEFPTEVFSLYDLVDDYLECGPPTEQTEILINDMEKCLARLKASL